MNYYCQGDGGQWNVKVDIVQSIPGTMLRVVRAIESGTLVGQIGNDGHIYAIVPECDLFANPQE